MNPVAVLRRCKDGDTEYEQLWFVCPGCALFGYSGLHAIPVRDTKGKRPSWTFDGNMEKPTLSPSILTKHGTSGGVCHSFLRGGVFEFLGDCTHPLAGQKAPMVPLPDWFIAEDKPA